MHNASRFHRQNSHPTLQTLIVEDVYGEAVETISYMKPGGRTLASWGGALEGKQPSLTNGLLLDQQPAMDSLEFWPKSKLQEQGLGKQPSDLTFFHPWLRGELH